MLLCVLRILDWRERSSLNVLVRSASQLAQPIERAWVMTCMCLKRRVFRFAVCNDSDIARMVSVMGPTGWIRRVWEKVAHR